MIYTGSVRPLALPEGQCIFHRIGRLLAEKTLSLASSYLGRIVLAVVVSLPALGGRMFGILLNLSGAWGKSFGRALDESRPYSETKTFSGLPTLVPPDASGKRVRSVKALHPETRSLSPKVTVRVQVPNNHILSQTNLDNYYPQPKYLISGSFGPFG